MTMQVSPVWFALEGGTVEIESRMTGQKRRLLDGLSLTIRRGEWVQLVGANGSGKSTFVRLLCGQLSGEYEVRAVRLYRLGDGAKHSSYPYVMQQPEAGFLGATPYEDIWMGLGPLQLARAEAAARVEEALEALCLTDVQHVLLEKLSGGQKQLTAIAACLALHAPLLVLDEATAMLDPDARLQVLQAVRNLHRQGRTVVWVTHRMEEWRAQDRIVALSAGKLAYDGNVADFFRPADQQRPSACEQLGWEPPFAVRAALALEAGGQVFRTFPVTADELAEEVSRWR